MGGHCGTAEGRRRRGGEDHLLRHCYLRGPLGRRERWQDDVSPNAFTASKGHTVFMVTLGGGGGMLWSFKKNKSPSSPLPPRVQNKHSFGMLLKVLALGKAIFIFMQRCGLQFPLVLLCSRASHQGECKLC